MPTFSEPVDFAKTEARNLVTHKLPVTPANPVEGQRYYDTSLKKEGVYNGATWDYAGAGASTGLGLLVYAQQNVDVPLVSYVYGLVPFDTEVFDPQGLFLNGYFTPAVTAIYRVRCHLSTSVSSSMGFYGVQIHEGNTPIDTLYSTDTYVAYAVDTYSTDLPLTAATAYSIKVSCGGTSPEISVDSSVKNSLTIERLA